VAIVFVKLLNLHTMHRFMISPIFSEASTD